jgi:integrase
MPVTRSSRYQQGTIDQVQRSKGEDVWVFRWRETAADGSRVQRKKTIGDLSQFPTEKSAWQAIENLRAEINSAEQRVGKTTVADAWGHFQIHELCDPRCGAVGLNDLRLPRLLQESDSSALGKGLPG